MQLSHYISTGGLSLSDLWFREPVDLKIRKVISVCFDVIDQSFFHDIK